jgi:hypothetical protein
MLKSKKAGCSSYASVSDDYILYNKSVKPVSGGRKAKKGGDFMSSLPGAFKDATAALNNMNAVKGGKGGCNSCGARGGAKGGAVELAPFAASLAFLAARMAVDKELNFKKLMGMGKAKSATTKSRKSPVSKSRKAKSV